MYAYGPGGPNVRGNNNGMAPMRRAPIPIPNYAAVVGGMGGRGQLYDLNNDVSQLNNRLLFAQAETQRTQMERDELKKKLELVMDKYSQLAAENKILKTTSREELQEAYDEACHTLDDVARDTTIAMAFTKLEKKVQSKSKEPKKAPAEETAKVPGVEKKREDEGVSIEKLRETIINQNSQIEIYEAVIARFQNVFRTFADAAAETSKEMDDTVTILGGGNNLIKKKDERNLQPEDEEMRSGNTSPGALGVVTDEYDGNKWEDSTPPSAVLNAIISISAEELEELEGIDVFGLDD